MQILLLALCISSTLADCPAAWKTFLNSEMEENTANGCEADWKFVNRPSTSILAQVPESSGSLWTGLRRTKKCIGQKITATCTNLTSFEWTDGSSTGTDGFVFQAGQPDNKNLDQNCALFLASKTPTVVANKGTYYAASYEDTGCEVGEFSEAHLPRKILGHVCGKKASK
ncbi:Protein CBR-CLEC-130 [Caenorhabditis briggsae]|uniref:Protein CBR-CLEC-130 n=1 Tax=Caenorhabditis briggsae TaxID=6238 RepID=A8XRQ3_CAEBR|nr:Protein CBR-CLEC-130 [Caenorhabditis briggsae]CAP35327.1 Protein CBR-CLEC-130 [Caenorhabditis briggsae]